MRVQIPARAHGTEEAGLPVASAPGSPQETASTGASSGAPGEIDTGRISSSVNGNPTGIPNAEQASLLTFGYAENNALEQLCPKEKGMKAVVPGERPSAEALSPKRVAYKKAAQRAFKSDPNFQHGMVLYMTCVEQNDKACVENVLTVMCEGTTPPGSPAPR